jgi:hypothetical protein
VVKNEPDFSSGDGGAGLEGLGGAGMGILYG